MKNSPLETVEAADCTAPPSAQRVECPICRKQFGGGAIVTDEDNEWSDDACCFALYRRLYCDHCHHVVVWMEGSNAAGRPTGVLLDSPCILRGKRTVDAFLAAHPEAAGVEA